MTINTTRMLSPDAKPIFLEVEVDHIGDKTGTLPNVTQIQGYDPVTDKAFHVYTKLREEQSQEERDKFKDVYAAFDKWARDVMCDRKPVIIAYNCWKQVKE